MKIKILVPQMIALSLLAAPAFAADYQSCARDRDGALQITGDQMTDSGMAGNAIRTGSFVRPKDGFLASCAREETGYSTRTYGHRHRGTSDTMNGR